jgi:1-phosphofructokinase
MRIITLTLNPSLDYYLDTELKIGEINRAEGERFFAGGKGINVSRVLHKMGVETLALGFIGGWTGSLIKQQCPFKTDFIEIEGNSRVNVKICGKDETEINAKGPTVDYSFQKELLSKAESIGENDVVVLTGSLPPGVQDDFYRLFAEKTKSKYIVADTTGDKLREILKCSPFLIKPNHLELGELFGTQIDKNDTEKSVRLAKTLQKSGTKNILVSHGDVGAVLITESDVFVEKAIPLPLKSSVGAGDTLLALFLAAYFKNFNHPAALNFAVSNVARFM